MLIWTNFNSLAITYLITRLIAIDIAPLTVLFCNSQLADVSLSDCLLLKGISFNTK